MKPETPPPKRSLSPKLSAGVLALLITMVGSFEGLRQIAYNDPVGIPTICFGYTHGVKLGDKKSKEECSALLAEELEVANASVNRCLGPVSDNERAAYTSLVYNAGPKAVCGSTIQKRFKQGDRAGACNAITMWVYSKGIKLPGLVKRREAEKNLCLAQ